MIGVVAQIGNRHLMRAPESFDFQSVDLLRAGPALRAAQHDHRPARWTLGRFADARALLDRADLVERIVERVGHQLMHRGRVVALDEQRLIAIADETGCAAPHRRMRARTVGLAIL